MPYVNKSPIKAFWLSFIPGLGHYYIGRRVRPFIYALGFFGPAAIAALILFFRVVNGYSSHADRDMFLLATFVGLFVGVVNLIDISLFLLSRPVGYWSYRHHSQYASGEYSSVPEPIPSQATPDSERFRTILLSVVPGLGHFQLGLMHRGAAFLLSFFGLFTMVIFLALAVFGGRFLVFLLALPAIWLYNLFDVMQLLSRKQNGETLIDRTIFEEFEESRQEGRKSKTLATILAIFPGAGHMYLGLQRRGLQLMAAFLLTVYMLDVLRLSLFLFLVPIIWFYGFFDALQHVSRQGKEEVQDVPLVDWLMNHQKWIGIGLLALGAYYLFDQLILGLLQEHFPKWRIHYWFHRYFQTFVVGTVLIGGGIRLLVGGKRRKSQ